MNSDKQQAERAPLVRFYCVSADNMDLRYYQTEPEMSEVLTDLPVLDMKAGPDRMVAVQTDDGDHAGGLVVIYREGRKLGQRPVRGQTITLLGWSQTRLLVRQDDRLAEISPAGALRDLGRADGLRSVATAGAAQVRLHDVSRSLTLEILDDGQTQRWSRNGLAGELRAIGQRWVVAEMYPAQTPADSQSPGWLWAVSLPQRRDKLIPMPRGYKGFCRGPAADQVLVGVEEAHDRFTVLSRSLATGHSRPLSRLSADGSHTLLMDISPDGRWAILFTGYARVGPGQVRALRLIDGRTRVLAENSYPPVIV